MREPTTLSSSLSELYRYQFGEEPTSDPPSWPPDLFAFCAAALRRSGAYTCFHKLRSQRILNDAERVGGAWRTGMLSNISDTVPTEIKKSWSLFWEAAAETHARHGISGLRYQEAATEELLFMLAASDECSAGFGIPHIWGKPAGTDGKKRVLRTVDAAGDEAHLCVQPGVQGSTLGKQLDCSVGRVLPKMHTPQTGLTLRSFSHHLCYVESDEVQPRWFCVPGQRGDVTNNHHLNLLVVPWPFTLSPSQIVESRARNQKKGARFFRCVVDDSGSRVADEVVRLCVEATRVLGTVDGVVMPELALTETEYLILRDRILSLGLLLVCGVCLPPAGRRAAENRLCIDIPLSDSHAVHLRQKKHHRWKLERSQITKYGLGAKLNPDYTYWEDIPIEDRRLLFVVLRPWLVACPMICEDLARHDPVGELVRGVGPNLLIALLMDGPQVQARWSSRYAMAFADDPGCSVLSVTSLGMALLSNPPRGKSRSRVIALWKDAKNPEAQELELPADAQALALTLTVSYDTEYTADGRDDDRHSAYPVLTGVHPIRMPQDGSNKPSPGGSPVLISPQDSATLGRLAEQIEAHLAKHRKKKRVRLDYLPLLAELRGAPAKRIGYEMWASANGHSAKDDSESFADRPSSAELKTAELILKWARTNTWP